MVKTSPIKYSSDGFPKTELRTKQQIELSLLRTTNTSTVKCTVDTTLQGPHSGCKVTRKNDAWVIYLDQPDGEPLISDGQQI